MGDTRESNSGIMQRLQQFSVNQIEDLNSSQFRAPTRQFSSSFSGNCSFNSYNNNNGKRAGFPPSHPNTVSPYSQIPVSRSQHSRSMSQPSSFSALDSLPPLSPSPYRDSPGALGVSDVKMDDKDVGGNLVFGNLPPRKAHRRSRSDIPFGLSGFMQSSESSVKVVKNEFGWDSSEKKPDGEVIDDLVSAYMNLDNIDALNSSGTETREDLDSRASGSKTNAGESSDNEAESSINESGRKRSAGSDLAPTSRHHRSVSMDSFMGKLNFGEESPKMTCLPGSHQGLHSPSNSMDGTCSSFSLEFANGEFSEAEMKKIMENEKLAEVAMSDPKRAKRILANRQSAARSKERKMRYISELEHKVQILQTEATTLSAQLTHLQRDSFALTNQNNEMRLRLQAMEQQAHLRDALNEALTAEVQRLKLATAELSGESAKSMISQLSVSPQMFQMEHRQPTQHQHTQPQLHTQPQQPSQHQNSGSNTKMESNNIL